MSKYISTRRQSGGERRGGLGRYIAPATALTLTAVALAGCSLAEAPKSTEPTNPSPAASATPAGESQAPRTERLSTDTCSILDYLDGDLSWRKQPIELAPSMGTFVIFDERDRKELVQSITADNGTIPNTPANLDVLAAASTTRALGASVSDAIGRIKTHNTSKGREITPKSLKWVNSQGEKLIPMQKQAIEAIETALGHCE